ncbi:acetyl-CoA carboxylase biotin carboxyl carrier protein [Marinilongibacter aquaticus]|uniref:acetyl-CoA carboxylase biotin carboxyl carrier protein n=1 Tax=Marinilongibacter aquaticus TaxID=2975157 RepID=UPI0021BDD26E|nr:acetyl-CoA carboxylase biotin carboxyl carrier protein [Marinilongibacter aquaticus]UBM58518.1 acetyl-CoA carboxylase biotin carboxyl carrier protein [Marinilongibacter aquaticus]
METKEIQKLIDFIAKSDLDEVKMETSELKLHVRRNAGVVTVPSPAVQAVAPAPAAPVAVAAPAPAAAESAASPEPAAKSNLVEIKSPMIGTFYRASGPEKPNFKEVGDDVNVGEVICIIEAMKLFNEIESEVKGKIVKILVDDASPVEFDQPLFLVEPA